MGTSRETGGSRAAGGATRTSGMRNLTAAEARELRSRGIPANTRQRVSQNYNLNAPAPAARTRGGAVSAEEFQRATGVNPRTGRRRRSR